MPETTKTPKAPAKPRKTASKTTKTKEITELKAQAAEPVAGNGHVASARVPRLQSISRDEIAKLAHQFWAERGHRHGHHVDDWLRAEQELRKRAS